MTASNLGIIFGPTLVKPRQTDAEVSLSSLVDYPYQALMVEQLVRHFNVIFDRNAAQLSTSDLQLAAGGGQASPRLTAQEKEQRLSRHSTSLLDIKEVRADVYVCVSMAAGRSADPSHGFAFSCITVIQESIAMFCSFTVEGRKSWPINQCLIVIRIYGQ